MLTEVDFPHLRVGGRFVFVAPKDVARFMSKIVCDANGCWLWQGRPDSVGYGQFAVNRECTGAHRVAWAIWRGYPPDPPSYRQLDHLCRVTMCVNPEHLEDVPRGENVRRGYAAGSRARTHCKNGHEFTPENTYHNQERNGNWRRQCKTCIIEHGNARRQRLKDAR